MSHDINKKGFLERIPSFSLILIMVVLMVGGAALIPMLRITYHPSPEQRMRSASISVRILCTIFRWKA